MSDTMNRNKGFSFVELLVAMTILSVVMILVTQFMSTSTGALGKTKKNLSIQTEALEIGEQISDVIMQASYIRVEDNNGNYYVVDNYPNWINGKSGTTDRIIVLRETVTPENGKQVRIVDDKGVEYDNSLMSFRTLDGTTNITPAYIFVQYFTKDEGTEKQKYAIYHFDGNNIALFRGDVASGAVNDYYDFAKNKVNAEPHILSDQVQSVEFNADVDANSVFLNIDFEESRYHKYTYTYTAPIKFRNTNVLTVAPQKLFEYVD